MRWLTVVVVVLALAGCNGSKDRGETDTSLATETTTAPETPPRSFDELLARLPPFDEPASPEVVAWRKATISAFFERCVTPRGGADKASFVGANRRVLGEAAVFQGATFVNEYSIGQRDGNGCPEGLGPATYYTTYVVYRLPTGTKAGVVLAHYEREFRGWLETAPTDCERTFGQGPGYVSVSACHDSLRISVRARGPAEPPAPPKLPPRPFGAQYPIVTDLSAPEPTSDDVAPGETCERVAGGETPSIIIPPSPGVTARIDDKPFKVGRGTFAGSVVVEWSLGTVHGDCPPSELILSYPTITAFTIHEPVHATSGVARMPLLDVGRRPTLLRATAVSVDGARSRQVAVLLR